MLPICIECSIPSKEYLLVLSLTSDTRSQLLHETAVLIWGNNQTNPKLYAGGNFAKTLAVTMTFDPR